MYTHYEMNTFWNLGQKGGGDSFCSFSYMDEVSVIKDFPCLESKTVAS